MLTRYWKWWLAFRALLGGCSSAGVHHAGPPLCVPVLANGQLSLGDNRRRLVSSIDFLASCGRQHRRLAAWLWLYRSCRRLSLARFYLHSFVPAQLANGTKDNKENDARANYDSLFHCPMA